MMLRNILVFLVTAGAAASAVAAVKTESFDRDPNWDGHNNRTARTQPPVTVRQDFGYSETSHAGGTKGEIGGYLTQAAEPAYYAAVIEPKTFQDRLSASGTFVVRKGGTPDNTGAHLLLGFFNSETVNDWRTPNTIAIRITARGDTYIPFLEYYTSKWRIGGLPGGHDFTKGKQDAARFVTGDKVHTWKLEFDPKGNDGKGVITASIDDATAVINTDPAYLADGATFNRFGILNVTKAAAGKNDSGSEFYVDDVTINGQRESFDRDPKWDQKNNRRTYETGNARPRFDFGYSDTNFAGGKSKGEIGGQIFRGDCRFPDRLACYGDKVGPLKLDKPIEASGKIAFTRGVSDSTSMFGFYNSRASMAISQRQDIGGAANFLGIVIEGPSSEGFYFYPAFSDAAGRGPSGGRSGDPLSIRPDGKPHDWSLRYDPAAAAGKGSITVVLDGRSVTLDLEQAGKDMDLTFDRFGIVTTWVDGNGQNLYLDDLSYTSQQDGNTP